MRGIAVGNGVHILMILVIIAMGYYMVGGQFPDQPEGVPASKKEDRIAYTVNLTDLASDTDPKNNLQMKTFSGTPMPTTGGPTKTCNTTEPVDVMVTLDYSGSMKGEKLNKAKEGIKHLASILETNSANRMGINSFNDSAKLYIGVTDNFTLVKATIDNLPTGGGGTCIKCGIDMAREEIAKTISTAAEKKKINILLTDGKATRPQPESGAGQLALEAARQAHAQTGMNFYTVGFGTNVGELLGGVKIPVGAQVNEALLQQIATETKGKYYLSQNDDQLKSIFEDIGLIVCN